MASGRRVLLWTGGITAVLLLLGGVGWSYLTEREDPPETSDYALDLVEVRRLAAEPHGRRAHTVHSLLVARTSMPRAAIFAGASFEAHPMVRQVFQLVFPDSTLLIDSGFGPAGFETGGRGGSLFRRLTISSKPRGSPARARSTSVASESAGRICWTAVSTLELDHREAKKV